MEQLRKVFVTIGTYLGRLTPSQRLLAGSVAVIIALTLGLVALWTGRSQRVELMPGGSATDLVQASEALRQSGIAFQMTGSSLLVSPDDRDRALAAVGEAGKLPADSSAMFKNILERQTWHTSRKQSEQLFLIDLQNLLSSMISKFKGVRSAQVVLDLPEPSNLGSATPKPSASVVVFTESGGAMPQATVDAIAALVAGARSGMERSRVKVVDGSTGRERRVSNDGDAAPGTYLEQAAKVEAQVREKLLDLLSYIPGVRVQVSAQVDIKRVSAQVQRHFEVGEGTLNLVRKETGSRTTSAEASPAAEPGVRSNVGLDINNGSGAGGSRSDQNETTEEFEAHVGKRTESIVDPRGMPTLLAASIAVPRGYVAELVRRSRPAAPADAGAPPAQGGEQAAAEPTEEEVRQAFAAEQARIAEALRPHLKTVTGEGEVVEGEVSVSMVPIDVTLAAAPAGGGVLGAILGGGGGGAGGAAGGWALGDLVEKIVLGVLALVAVGAMLLSIRRGGVKAELPSAEDLAGVPPTLETKNDLIGEADESETAMAGIEVNEEVVQSQKILDQVGELVSKDPDAAAKLIGRWVTAEM